MAESGGVVLVEKRESDVVFGRRNNRYKGVLLKYGGILESTLGSVENWGDAAGVEAPKALMELKSEGGRLVKPIQRGPGNSPIIGHSLLSDDDALKLLVRDIKRHGYDVRTKVDKAVVELEDVSSDDDSSTFSDSTVAISVQSDKSVRTLQPNDIRFCFEDNRYKKLIMEHAQVLEAITGGGKGLSVQQRRNNGSKQDQHAAQVLSELKGFGGNLLKPIRSGMGRSSIVGYDRFENDDDTLEKIKKDLRSTVYDIRKQKRDSNEIGNSPDVSSSTAKRNNYVQPNSNDVILSLANKDYREKMFNHFRAMDKGRNGSKEYSVLVLKEFNESMGRGGRFLKCDDGKATIKKYYDVTEKVAAAKIRNDLSRRMESSHRWQKRGSNVLEVAHASQIGRKKNKAASPKKAQDSIRRGQTKSARESAGSAVNRKANDAIGSEASSSNADSGPSESDNSVSAKASEESAGEDKTLEVYCDIKQKLSDSTTLNEKKFYGHLKRHLAQRDDEPLTLTELKSIEECTSKFDSRMEMMDGAADLDDIRVFQRAIDRLMRNVEEDFPVAG